MQQDNHQCHTPIKGLVILYEGTYILDDGYTEVLHVLDDTLLFHGDLGVLHQLGQVLFTDSCM